MLAYECMNRRTHHSNLLWDGGTGSMRLEDIPEP